MGAPLRQGGVSPVRSFLLVTLTGLATPLAALVGLALSTSLVGEIWNFVEGPLDADVVCWPPCAPPCLLVLGPLPLATVVTCLP